MRSSLLALVALVLPSIVFAAPQRYAQQGALSDASGAPLVGSHTLTFRMYDSASGGSVRWSEAQDVTFRSGRYDVVLGGAAPLDATLLADHPLWLELEVDGVTLSPRQEVTSAPYAELAGTAERVQGEVDATVLRVGGREVLDGSGAWIGGVAWDSVTGVPADLADGDSDVLAGLSCADGDIATWDAVVGAWSCSPDADTLADVGCLPGEYAAFDGVAWGCADPPEVALAAVEARVATCETDLGALAARVTAAEGSLVTLEGRVTTGEGARSDLDARLANVEGATTGLTTLAYTGRFSDLVAVPGDLADGDDDTLASLACTNLQMPVYTLTTRSWACGDDTDTTLTPAEVRAIVRATGIDLAAGSTIGGRTPRFVDEPDTLTALSCGDGEIPRWDALLNAWTCDVDRVLTEADVDAMVADNGYASASSVTSVTARVTTAEGTLTTLGSTVSGHTSALAWHGTRLGALEGASDADTLAALSCSDGDLPRWDAALGAWGCGTETLLTEADVDAMVADNGYASASTVTALGGRVTTAEGTLTTLGSRVTTAEGTLTTLGSTVSGHTSTLASQTSTLASHGSRLGTLEGATDGDTLAGLSCADGEEAAWDAVLGDWTCAEDAVRSVADVIASVAGQIVAPSRVEVGNTRVTDGTLDLGTASDDALTAAMVRTLTGGGDADALHTHAGAASGGGACYTAWGTTSCGTGFTAMYTGWGMVSYTAASSSDVLCASSASLTPDYAMSRSLLIRVGTDRSYNYNAGINCAVCCK